MDKNGFWQFAPVYDLTFSSSTFGNHSTSISGEYRNPNTQHLLELAHVFGVKNPKNTIERVKQAVSNWKGIAVNCGVSKESINLIQKTIAQMIKL